MLRWGLRTLALGVVGAVVAGSAGAATRLADPIVGTWKISKGGSGTVKISERLGVLAITATDAVQLGCVTGGKGFLVGIIDLPSDTKLPQGRYNANFGVAGQGCYYNVALRLVGGKLTGTIVYNENDQPGGPFTLVKAGGATYSWSARTKSIVGSGRVSVDAGGKVTAATGALSAGKWKLAVRTPAKLAFGTGGAFTLTLAANVTRGDCSDKSGFLVLTAERARLTSVCGKTVTDAGSVALR